MPDKINQAVPEVLTLITADVVHQDPDTQKFSLLGVHKIIGCKSFPAAHPRMVVYVELIGRARAHAPGAALGRC
jgi:hypothetical protein